MRDQGQLDRGIGDVRAADRWLETDARWGCSSATSSGC